MKRILQIVLSIMTVFVLLNFNQVRAEEGVIRVSEDNYSYYCVGEGFDSPPEGASICIDGKYYYFETGWKIIDGYWHYFNPQMYTNGISYINDAIYYFDSDGIMKTGWIREDQVGDGYSYTLWYFADENGVVQVGWHKINGKWYYFSPEMYSDGISYIDDCPYYFNKSGWMMTGWIERVYSGDDYSFSEWYYAEPSGRLLEGWQTIGGKTYYLSPEMATGIRWIDGNQYYFDDSGALQKGGWIRKDEIYDDHTYTNWFYADENGVLKTGWQKIAGKWYYLDPYMYYGGPRQLEDNKWYYFNDSGAMQTGWIKREYKYDEHVGYDYFYAYDNGVLGTGWQKIDNKWYYFEPNYPFMYRDGRYEINGKNYYFDESGVMQTGWIERTYYGDDWSYTERYYADGSGALQSGWQKINNTWYYFDTDYYEQYIGRVADINGKQYYFKVTDGAMITGLYTETRDGYQVTYYADGSGVLQSGWQRINNKWCYFDPERAENGSYYINNKHYLFKDGYMVDSAGWQSYTYNFRDGEHTYWYYSNSDGTIVEGWKQIWGTWYYFVPNSGLMVTGAYVIDGELNLFNSSGAWKGAVRTAGWRNESYMGYYDAWYYVKANGKAAVGWEKIDNKWYYFYDSGIMASGPEYIDGKTYFLGQDGALVSAEGWQKDTYTVYYYDDTTETHVDWYYVGSDGVCKEGWLKYNNQWYYLRPTMCAGGEFYIDGEYHLFDSNGVWLGKQAGQG